MEQNDEELIQIFLEEAHDLTEEINEQVRIWQSGPAKYESLVPILHALHTLKGSARMLNFAALGEYVHGLEQIIQILYAQKSNLSASLLKELLAFIDVLNDYFDIFSQTRLLPPKILPIDQLKNLLQQLKAPVTSVVSHPLPEAENEPKDKPQHPVTALRIKVERLESFNKLAGQINISRSHLEQQLAELRKLTAAMNKELIQLQDQLRYMLTETDKEFKSHVDSHSDFEEFDIIEFDRFSALQQSVYEAEGKIKQLDGISELINETVRNAETTLVEQKRAAQALEAEIIHVRMVSTEQLVYRLERIVRQVSRELGKEVHFECTRSQGEVDRKILENLIFPLEHMVRNAIDHGIELPAIRKNLHKPAYGKIMLSIYKQGNEMVIQLADDGQGIAIEKIRQRAIDKKLWLATERMSLADAVQMISLPGFSTKEKITPISGRGVGLDVVIAAINKIGGSLQVESQQHIGSQFTIRLPFTLSLNRALIFTVAKQYYAILLSNLVGLTRQSFLQIKHKVNYAGGKLSYMQDKYKIAFLREILGEGTRADYKKKQPILPIIFLKYNDKKIALVVDDLIGSQEIMVKPTGIQLRFVREIAGISLLGDSQVVLILDSPFIIQAAFEQSEEPTKMAPLKVPVVQSKVLIIDDSATVRQVMSRMLQRYGYEARVAKDGVDALRMMKTDLPDIILLDIEMPRMNGYKLLEKLRAEPHYQNIPVIMITSRSGEKHRQKAEKIGAACYLNKPFKEEELIKMLKALQGKKQDQHEKDS